MNASIIAEIGSWYSPKESESIVDAIDTGVQIGVVVKGTQGLWWQRPDYSEVVDYATGAGVLTGHLHYCEPDANTPEDEAAAIAAVLQDAAAPLGVWLELDNLGTKQAYELGPWVNTIVTAISSPRRRVAVLARGDLLEQLTGVDPSVRLVVVSDPDTFTGASWAKRVYDVDGFEPEVVLYSVNSPRGINPWDTQVARLSKPREVTPPSTAGVADSPPAAAGGDLSDVQAA